MCIRDRVQTNRQRNIEENRLHLVAEALRHLDPLLALVRAQVGGVHVVPRHLGDQPRAQQAAQSREDETLVALVGDVVEEQGAEEVAGERGDAAAFVPCLLYTSRCV